MNIIANRIIANRIRLTPKQEKFCQCIVSGMSGKDSYMTAYDCKNERVARNEAPKLLQRNDITQRIDQMIVPLQNHAVNTAISQREEVQNMLLEFMRDNTLSPEIRMKASDQLNKMNMEYININRNIETHDANIVELDTASLKKLSGTS